MNPPVHPWATIFTYRLEMARTGKGDLEWLERSFQKLLSVAFDFGRFER